MPNYTKLFNSIVTSTIWTEDDKTRILWITMLAMSDQNGEVHASIPGLARIAGIDMPSAEKALESFLSPDPYSRTPDNEGRRIAKIDGGWELLNHAKYRKMASKEDSKAATAERVRRHRERSVTVTPCNGHVTVRRDIAEADTDTEANTKKKSMSAKADELAEILWPIFSAKSKSRSSKDKLKEFIAKAKPSIDTKTLKARLTKWAATDDWTKDGGQFAPGAHLWFKDGKYKDDPPEDVQSGSTEESPLGFNFPGYNPNK